MLFTFFVQRAPKEVTGRSLKSSFSKYLENDKEFLNNCWKKMCKFRIPFFVIMKEGLAPQIRDQKASRDF